MQLKVTGLEMSLQLLQQSITETSVYMCLTVENWMSLKILKTGCLS